MLVTPENFGLVEPGIYRCSKVESDNFPFLETLKLRSIIVLDAEKPTRTLNNFLQPNNIELYNLGELKVSNHNTAGFSSRSRDDDSEASNRESYLDSSKGTIDVINLNLNGKKKSEEWMLIEGNIVVSAFELLFNKSKYNILLIDSTSTLVGILRKIQKWNFSSILNEYRIYSGSSSKSNYYAENFLELIQTELIPYEVDEIHHQIKALEKLSEGKFDSSDPLPQREFRGSVSSVSSTDGNDNDIDDDDVDDDKLSASPQIPANLLKLVEEKKLEKSRDESSGSDSDVTQGTPPNRIYRNSVGDSLQYPNKIMIEKRRPSLETKSYRPYNVKFWNSPSSNLHIPLSRSYESVMRRQRKDSRDASRLQLELEANKEKYNYNYYKNLNKNPISFENVHTLKLKLPPSHKLPDWFINGRDFWEDTFKKLNA